MAVIGTSAKRNFFFLKNHQGSFKGALYAINPTVKEIPDFPKENIYKSIKDIVENSQNILAKLSGTNGQGPDPKISVKDLESYNSMLEKTSSLSSSILQNFRSAHELLDKMNRIPAVNPENITAFNNMANSLTTAAKSLSDEKTLTGLKHLESIVVKK